MTAGPIMIMAGGTGGHVFPGLAVADELKARDCDVVWLGTHRGLEARLVPQHGIEIEWITIAGVRGRGVLALDQRAVSDRRRRARSAARAAPAQTRRRARHGRLRRGPGRACGVACT